MSKNNSTVKNVRRNALEVIIQGLSLSDSEKLKLHEDLRNMRIADDNDPIVKFTMIQGLLAKYTGETAEKIVQERENIEESVEDLEELRECIYNIVQQLRKRDLAELKDSIKIWKNEAIIGTQKVIVELRHEEERLKKQNKKQEEELHKSKEKIHEAEKEHDEIVNRGVAVNVAAFIILAIIATIFAIVIYVHGYEKLEKEVIKRQELIDAYNVTPKIVKYNGKAYVLTHRDNVVRFTNGTTGIELDTWSVVDDIW